MPLNPGFNAQQVIAALGRLKASSLIIGAETNLFRKEPRSNISLLQHIVPNMKGQKVESEVVPSLRDLILVENSAGRVNLSSLRCAIDYEQILHDGHSLKPFAERLDPHDIINIQFTSGKLCFCIVLSFWGHLKTVLRSCFEICNGSHVRFR